MTAPPVGGGRIRAAGRAGEHLVPGEQRIDVTLGLHLAAGEDHQVVADPLQVLHQVGGQQHGDPIRGGGGHQGTEKVAPCQRVQAGHRLVKNQ